MMRSLLGVMLSLGACATAPAAMRAADTAWLTQADAERVTAAWLRKVAPDPRREPRSLDDVLDALRRDRIDDFAAAYRFTVEHAADPRARALGAQLQLSWGEDELIVAEILWHETMHSRERVRLDIGALRAALARDARAHLELGAELARGVIATSPGDYHGYRLAADYYRTVGDWPSFDRAIAQIELMHPQSIGYLFLRGMEQLARYHDRHRAAAFFRAALERDPKFARAEVQLLLARGGIASEWDDYRKLAAISPDHQIVVWLGPFIERQHARWLEEGSRHDLRQQDLTEDLAFRGR